MAFACQPSLSKDRLKLIAPETVLVEALNSRINLQRFKILYICGNYSRILSSLDRNFVDMERSGGPSLPFSF